MGEVYACFCKADGCNGQKGFKRGAGEKGIKSYAGKNTFLHHYYRRGGQGLPHRPGLPGQHWDQEEDEDPLRVDKEGQGGKALLLFVHGCALAASLKKLP